MKDPKPAPPPIDPEPIAVEPLPDGKAWSQGDHSERVRLQLRPVDLLRRNRLMRGLGIKSSQFDRWLFQTALTLEELRQDNLNLEGKPT